MIGRSVETRVDSSVLRRIFTCAIIRKVTGNGGGKMKKATKIISLILLTSMSVSVTSCVAKDKNVIAATPVTTAAVETSDMSGASVTTAQTTSINAITPTPTPVSVIPDPFDTEADQYSIIMDGIDEIEGSEPGEFLYYVDRCYSSDIDSEYLVLSAVNGDMRYKYCISGGEIVLFDTSVINDEDLLSRYFTYDEIKRFPLFPEHMITERTGQFVDTLNDGTYFGELLAISEDGRYGLFYLGTPVGFDRTTVDSLQEGDEVGYEDLTVSSITENEGGRCIVLGDGYLYFNPNYESYTGTILLCSDDNIPITQDDVMVILPISDTCTITDSYADLSGQESDIYIQWQTAERTGDPFFDSFFWSYVTEERFSGVPTATSMGWYDLRFTLSYPVVITDGEATQMNLEWR